MILKAEKTSFALLILNRVPHNIRNNLGLVIVLVSLVMFQVLRTCIYLWGISIPAPKQIDPAALFTDKVHFTDRLFFIIEFS